MNIERGYRIAKRDTTPEAMARTVSTLANFLSSNRWQQEQTKEVRLVREISDQVGGNAHSAISKVEPIVTKVAIEFYGHKVSNDTIEDEHFEQEDEYGDRDEEEYTDYHLISTIRQRVSKDEVPEEVLDEIFEDHGEEDDDEHEEEGSILDVLDRDDDFSSIEIQRQQSVEYIIDDEGIIQGYTIEFRYYVEDEVVHETTYSDMDEKSREESPIINVQADEILEWRPTVTLLLTEMNIESEIQTIDEDIYMLRVGEALSLGGQDQAEHRRRAMGMIAMLTSGLFTMRQLAGR